MFDHGETLGEIPWTCLGDPFCAAGGGGPVDPQFPGGGGYGYGGGLPAGYGGNGGTGGNTGQYSSGQFQIPQTVTTRVPHTAGQTQQTANTARTPPQAQTLPFQLPAALPPTIAGIDTKTLLIGAGALALVALFAGKGK